MGNPAEAFPANKTAEDIYDQYDAPPPAYTDSQGKALAPVTTKFPPELNAYFSWKLTSRTLHLGPSAEQKLYAATMHWGSFTGKKPSIVIHDGPSDKDEILATTGNENWKHTKYKITVPARGARTDELTVVMSAVTFTQPSYKLSIPVREKGEELEEFEWRSSSGVEMKDLAKGSRLAWGWKLVRLSGPNVKPGGSSTADREAGFTSDGREVVALVALSSSTLTKAVRFSFYGTGLTGTLGETWEIVALTSAMQIWYEYYQSGNTGAAASSAAASSAAAAAT